MKIRTINGKDYKLPNKLNSFQENLYVYLINYKWDNITHEPGIYKGDEYDAILPESEHSNYPIIYEPILNEIFNHNIQYKFKLHKHFNHMASSQAANINLFLPILLSVHVDSILKKIKPDYKKLAPNQLFKGFRIEYWDGNSNDEKGLLGDHNARSGTDSDIAIAYYNKKDELSLWLIEHKLSETEFTTCGGFDSPRRDKSKHQCEKSFEEICNNNDWCYYHNVINTNYWRLTTKNKEFFKNHSSKESCPFKNGENQLWRNQILGLAIEQSNENPYKNVFFSVVHHPNNTSLNKTISKYQNLVDYNEKFSTFTSNEIVDIASLIKDKQLNKWVSWYVKLYNL